MQQTIKNDTVHRLKLYNDNYIIIYEATTLAEPNLRCQAEFVHTVVL